MTVEPESDVLPSSDRIELGRDFRLYATGQAVSVVGDRIAAISLVFLVIHLSHSYAPALAVFYLCTVLPPLFGGLLVGVLVDHFDRRRVMVACDVGRAVVITLAPALSTSTLWTLYPLVVLLYGLTLVFDTAARAALPDVVTEGAMMEANAILRSIETSADFAYAIGGALVFFLKLKTPFYIDAATFLFSAAMVSSMRLPVLPRGPLPSLPDVGVRIREGLSFLMRQPFLRWSTFAFAIAPFAGGVIFVLTPLYASHFLTSGPGLVGPFRSGAFRFSMLEVAVGVGALLGSGVVIRMASSVPKGRLFGAGFTGLGLSYMALAATSNLFVAALFLISAGLFNSMFVISGMTLLQTLTPTDRRGRVIAARLTIINGSLALGSLCGGFILLTLTFREAWVVMGGILVLSSALIWAPKNVREQM